MLSPAKINLTLHITGKRGDGFHLLDSLVAFTNYGDTVTLTPQSGFGFTVSGPYAGAFAPQDMVTTLDSRNLVVRAAHHLAQATGNPLDVAIHLNKNLPLGSGIGGGSSNAATTLAGLASLWDINDSHLLTAIAAELGSDVPVCMPPHRAAQMRGVGDVLVPLANPLPHLHLLLVNPNIPCPTPAVYRALHLDNYTAAIDLPAFTSSHDLVDFLARHTRNDMTAAAINIVPAIADVLTDLDRTSGCLLARMSGSGATCFGVFADKETVNTAALHLQTQHPAWWVMATETID